MARRGHTKKPSARTLKQLERERQWRSHLFNDGPPHKTTGFAFQGIPSGRGYTTII